VAVATGCDGVADVAACLRGKSTAEIVAAVPGTLTVLPRVYGPNVDGHVFPAEPIERIRQKQYPAMPIIIGNTYQETNPWANTAGPVTDEASYATAVEHVFGAATRDRILAKYPVASFPSPRAAFVRMTTDAEFTCQTHRVARAFAQAQPQPVYRYLFTHFQENDPTLKAAGAAHTIEHAFLFPGAGTYASSSDDIAVQRLMIGYWTRMARTGDPNGAGDPHWPAFTRANDAYLRIGPITQAAQGPDDAQCDFWDGIKLSWPHL
jgi:para-nitrobenzyl esterase